MLRKALFKKHGYFQLILSTLGGALGFFVLLAGIQFYIELRSILLDKDQMSTTDFLVLHKKVSDMSMLKLKSNAFSEKEIEEIRSQNYVKEVGPIVPGLFQVYAELNGAGDLFEMGTAMYFEAVDDKFIDHKNNNWKWQEGDEEIPIILPSILLESYNFGMAPSQNLPPITEKTLKRFYYDIEISNKEKKAKFKGRIIGFSDRINSILVPSAFLKWANSNFQYKPPTDPAQLVIEVDDVTNPQLAKFLEDNNYTTNTDKLQSSRIKSVLNICLVVFLVLGLIIISMAALTFIQYARLSIIQVSYELKTLMSIGYYYTAPAAVFLKLYVVLNLLSLALAMGGLMYFKSMLTRYFEQYYFVTDKGLHQITLLVAGLTIIFFLSANVLSVFRLLKNLAKSLQ